MDINDVRKVGMDGRKPIIHSNRDRNRKHNFGPNAGCDTTHHEQELLHWNNDVIFRSHSEGLLLIPQQK